MRIRINGESEFLEKGSNINDLLESQGIEPVGVAIAINDTVIPKSQWSKTPVQDGDQVEIVRATQGG